MNFIVIEDEPLAMARITEFAARLPYLSCAGTFDDAVPALQFLKFNSVDLIFLDVNIGQISGIGFLEIAKPDCAVVIISAYQEYALKGFELQVTDYLLKPFTFERFCQAADHARTQRTVLHKEKDYLFIKTQYRLEKVLLNDLLYVEGARDYRRLHLGGKQLMTLETFGELEIRLPPARFMRVHKSYLVAVARIDSLERDFIRIKDQLIPVSETYKRALHERLICKK